MTGPATAVAVRRDRIVEASPAAVPPRPERDLDQSQLAAAVDRVRRDPHGTLESNYFFAPFAGAAVSAWEAARSLVFADRVRDFSRVYFLSRDLDELAVLLAAIPRRPLVGDYVASGSGAPPVDAAFRAAGFAPAVVYQRMTNANLAKRRGASAAAFARPEEAAALFAQLGRDFDARLDRLPEWAQFDDWVRNNQVLVRRKGDAIEGYAIYRLLGRRANLNYWYSRPGSHPASALKLLADFFSEMGARGIGAAYLWVKTTMEREIQVYDHLGFKADGLRAHVYLRD